MSTPHTPEDLCRELLRVLDSFTPQAIAELDQATFAVVRERVGSFAAELLEEYLWRLGNQTLPFALDGDNRHQAGVLAVRELAAEIRLAQQSVLHRHITLAQHRFIWPGTSL
jgi:hypothetical protein